MSDHRFAIWYLRCLRPAPRAVFFTPKIQTGENASAIANAISPGPHPIAWLDACTNRIICTHHMIVRLLQVGESDVALWCGIRCCPATVPLSRRELPREAKREHARLSAYSSQPLANPRRSWATSWFILRRSIIQCDSRRTPPFSTPMA